jgi:hypothetical protein
MPILTNSQHELFAQGLAQGLSNRAAFAQAGYKPSDSTASHLANSDKVKARVDELIFALGNAGTPRMFVSLQALAGPSHSPAPPPACMPLGRGWRRLPTLLPDGPAPDHAECRRDCRRSGNARALVNRCTCQEMSRSRPASTSWCARPLRRPASPSSACSYRRL